MKWYIYGWLHSFDYHGRATLTQFWTFNFFHAIAVVLCYGLENWLQPDMSILQLYTTLALVSNLAAIVRRLHDTGDNGLVVYRRSVSADRMVVVAGVSDRSEPKGR